MVAEVGGIALVLIYGAAFVAALANPLTKRRQEVLCRDDERVRDVTQFEFDLIQTIHQQSTSEFESTCWPLLALFPTLVWLYAAQYLAIYGLNTSIQFAKSFALGG